MSPNNFISPPFQKPQTKKPDYHSFFQNFGSPAFSIRRPGGIPAPLRGRCGFVGFLIDLQLVLTVQTTGAIRSRA
jgi:hypothetical protein